MTQRSRLGCFVLGAFCIGHLYAQDLSQWKDPSSHSTRFVTVDKTFSWKCSTGVVPGCFSAGFRQCVFGCFSSFDCEQEKAVKDAVPTAHVGGTAQRNHFVFLSNEEDVLREIRDFVARLN